MIIDSIAYGTEVSVKVGDYQYQKIQLTMTAKLENGEDVEECYKALKKTTLNKVKEEVAEIVARRNK